MIQRSRSIFSKLGNQNQKLRRRRTPFPQFDHRPKIRRLTPLQTGGTIRKCTENRLVPPVIFVRFAPVLATAPPLLKIDVRAHATSEDRQQSVNLKIYINVPCVFNQLGHQCSGLPSLVQLLVLFSWRGSSSKGVEVMYFNQK